MEQGEAHVMSLLTIKGMADKKDERKVKKQKKKGKLYRMPFFPFKTGFEYSKFLWTFVDL